LLKAEYSTRMTMGLPVFHGTIKDWMLHWTEFVAAPTIRPSTRAGYRHKLQSYILPELGHKRLERLSGEDINAFKTRLRARGLSANSVSAVLRILSSAFSEAVRRGFLNSNPCDGRFPKSVRGGPKALSLAAQRTLEAAAWEEPGCSPVILGLYTGMRIGEISALMWEDIDLEAGFIHVHGTLQRVCSPGIKSEVVVGPPKSIHSRRSIPIATRLSAYLKRCLAESTGSGPVVTCEGRAAEPRVIRYRFARLLEKAGMSHMSFHSLRHTFSTRCLERGADVAALSALLGHSSIKLTLDTYTASMPGHRRTAMAALDDLIPAALNPRHRSHR
jgi:integrase